MMTSLGVHVAALDLTYIICLEEMKTKVSSLKS